MLQSKLRRNLLVALLLAQVITVLVLVLTSGRISADAEQQHTAQLLSATAAESAEAVQAHLEPAEALVDLATALLSETALDDETLEQTFQASLARTPQIAGAFLGGPDQDFLFVSREEDGFRHKVTTVEGADRVTRIGQFDANGDLTFSFEDALDTYDPTSRPWYIAAETTETETVWTDPYVFFTSQQLGITVSRAVIRDGDFVGVVGVDIELGSLSEFLADLEISDVGGTLLFDNSSTVIAHPDGNLLQVPEGDGFRPVSIIELEDSYAQSATGAFLSGDGMLTEGIQDFGDDGEGPSRVVFESIDIENVDWLLGVFTPNGSLATELEEARGQERILSIIAGALTILLLGIFLLPATKKIDDLERTAATDELTGISNRRSIMTESDNFALGSGPRALAMLDIDYFKRVNDTHGHQVGDEVLKTVVERLSSALPEGATMGRVGGEEFVILLPHHTEDEAIATCERLRSTIQRRPVETQAGEIHVTVSLGVVTTSGTKARDTLLSIADAALGEAKNAGRDRVVHQAIHEPTIKAS